MNIRHQSFLGKGLLHEGCIQVRNRVDFCFIHVLWCSGFERICSGHGVHGGDSEPGAGRQLGAILESGALRIVFFIGDNNGPPFYEEEKTFRQLDWCPVLSVSLEASGTTRQNCSWLLLTFCSSIYRSPSACFESTKALFNVKGCAGGNCWVA